MLDLGCAYGNHIFMTNARLGHDQDISYTGVELAEQRVAYANAFATAVPGNGNCRFLSADIEQSLPFPDDTFDAVNVADVIEHLPDPEGLLRELRRVTRPVVSSSWPRRNGRPRSRLWPGGSTGSPAGGSTTITTGARTSRSTSTAMR
jgi:SAM-dependent methyltransferase